MHPRKYFYLSLVTTVAAMAMAQGRVSTGYDLSADLKEPFITATAKQCIHHPHDFLPTLRVGGWIDVVEGAVASSSIDPGLIPSANVPPPAPVGQGASQTPHQGAVGTEGSHVPIQPVAVQAPQPVNFIPPASDPLPPPANPVAQPATNQVNGQQNAQAEVERKGDILPVDAGCFTIEGNHYCARPETTFDAMIPILKRMADEKIPIERLDLSAVVAAQKTRLASDPTVATTRDPAENTKLVHRSHMFRTAHFVYDHVPSHVKNIHTGTDLDKFFNANQKTITDQFFRYQDDLKLEVPYAETLVPTHVLAFSWALGRDNSCIENLSFLRNDRESVRTDFIENFQDRTNVIHEGLAKAIAANQSLKDLAIDSTTFAPDTIAKLCEGLTHHPTLKKLHLRYFSHRGQHIFDQIKDSAIKEIVLDEKLWGNTTQYGLSALFDAPLFGRLESLTLRMKGATQTDLLRNKLREGGNTLKHIAITVDDDHADGVAGVFADLLIMNPSPLNSLESLGIKSDQSASGETRGCGSNRLVTTAISMSDLHSLVLEFNEGFHAVPLTHLINTIEKSNRPINQHLTQLCLKGTTIPSKNDMMADELTLYGNEPHDFKVYKNYEDLAEVLWKTKSMYNLKNMFLGTDQSNSARNVLNKLGRTNRFWDNFMPFHVPKRPFLLGSI